MHYSTQERSLTAAPARLNALCTHTTALELYVDIYYVATNSKMSYLLPLRSLEDCSSTTVTMAA